MANITHYPLPENPYFSAFADRKRLSGPALRRLFKIAAKWKLNTRDTRLLLGGMSSRRYKQLSSRPAGRVLRADQLFRVLCLIGIDRSLRNLLPRRQASNWAQTPDRRLPGGTPLYSMIHNGPTHMWDWWQRLERDMAEKRKTQRRERATSGIRAKHST